MNVSQAAIEAARTRYAALTDEQLASEAEALQAQLGALDLGSRSLHSATTIALEAVRAEQKRRAS